RNLRDGSVKYNDIRLKTAGGFNLLSLRLVPTDNSSGLPDWLQRWNPDTASWTNVVEIFQNSPAIPNEIDMQTLQVGMDADGFGLFLDGSNLVGNLSYEYPGTTLQSFRLSSPDTASGVWYDDISIVALQNTNAPPVDPYIDWTIEMGLDETNNGQGDDPDGDGNDNLMEYAVGGDPLVVDKAALLANDGAFFYHIHKERTDDANLTYTVELDDNLVASDWGTAGITNVGESALVDNYKTVTNRTDLNNQEFIKLSVEKN
ncbi:hypothetical protein P4B35_22740, partial [Pontiellaceae bacterium B12227]|nr:hypothetical protein [Pontiellaceae bacterium B12227]